MSYTPAPPFPAIPHYHGDTVRILFFCVVALSFLVIPFWGHLLPFGTPFEILGGLVLVVLAGLTNPRSTWVMVLNVIAAAAGAFLMELAAISFRTADSVELLIAREAGALLLIAALYFSIKTARAMAQGMVGKGPSVPPPPARPSA